MLIYFYDLKIKGIKAYNTLKRRFYYDLGKSKLSTAPFRTKSVLIVPQELEGCADNFFKKYNEFIEVYKAKTNSIIQLN
ncbi:hypothetical protein AUJ17_03585 [Candidatus Micrarchaeota archaeon CG1_02_47_40]|nr:MAG: hypothetical protein AUJ17_03585 [Candidatus Micrarchaeota archaeon CG1_02_47_40]